MRIGFTGSHGTGKTSVAKSLVSDWTDYAFVPSSARQMAASGFSVNREADPLSQLLTTVARIADEDKLNTEKLYTVSDRTPLDSLAYTVYQSENIWSGVGRAYFDVTCRLVQNHMTKYDAIFYFPCYWTPKDDGLRDSDPLYQKAIDKSIQKYLIAMRVNHFVVPNESVSQRVIFVQQSIKSL